MSGGCRPDTEEVAAEVLLPLLLNEMTAGLKLWGRRVVMCVVDVRLALFDARLFVKINK